MIASLFGAASVALVASAAPADERFARALLEALIVGLPVLAGAYALRWPRTVRVGYLLIATGLLWSLTALAESSHSLPYSIGRVCAWVLFPPLVYLMLAFPSGRVVRRRDRRLFGAVTLVIVVLYLGSALFVEAYPEHTPWASCTDDCPANAFLLLGDEPAFIGDVVRPLREVLSVLLLGGVTLSIAQRWRAAGPVRRRTVGPVLAMCVVSTVSLMSFIVVRWAAPDSAATAALGWIWGGSIAGLAGGFLAGLARRRLMFGDMLNRLSPALTGRFDAGRLRTALRETLGDPGLDILAPGEAGLTEAAVTPIADDAGVAAVLVHDPALLEDAELIEAVRMLVLAGVRQDQLLNQLAESRKRIARAADLERSRIERDLHDGAQQRLIGLRINLSLAEELARTDPAAGLKAMHRLGDEVELALEDLRSLAHGVYPSLLSDRGLGDALRGMAASVPLTVHLAVGGVQRHPPEIETAVYFTCLEAAQNALKHGDGATGLWIALREDRGLRFEVRDDGPGFEPPTGEFNGGLRNMRDRIEAVGGRLAIDSAPGRGTLVRGVVPPG